MLGGVATGIPEKGYDGPEAEKIRQERVVANLKDRDPALFRDVAVARSVARMAQEHWDKTRTRLVAAVGHDGVHDVLAIIDAQTTEQHRKDATVNMEEFMKTYRAPEFVLSPEEQKELQAKRRAESGKK